MEIKLKHVGYTYSLNSPLEFTALQDINLAFPTGKFTAVVGKTGSGKSTLIKLLNGLELPTTGEVTVGDQVITNRTKAKQLKQVRKNVGMVFQFPENQLFAETVLKDVMFGPLNFGKSENEAKELAEKWLAEVGIQASLFEQSPFELSGGQMRRVALAGVLACEPEVLVLDEPSAGLDPAGNQNLMQLLKKLQTERGMTIIMVTHSMENVAEFADQVLVMKNGKVIADETPRELFSDSQSLVELPEASQFYLKLMKSRQFNNELPITKNELIKTLVKQFGQKGDQYE
ncbi:energy-coupling factor transporter ATPase [Fructilactobacillus lindneri]|uniref:Energy-coupling factor transporter ATP-binding protein EcfA2 n=2 Tax=Fructilactobacillus lindneri TaxID=53444 RepID=A0A0R2JWF1_9LACO|nr:energy-coupling factor transporter ATPase [Fructilactobacillus lindneri]ANZ57411.1 energy-coupling factor transporter ATPase [Fructilactobacillus lindneri]ANZ58678.1 energy-coupling factor transporter ATPase [Fructilactobacillus lindneri]KRN80022.1 cobalt import ATP-binding protein cbiO 1 [Fructilactobacillus lindneri DSM 20690 = JCM 11027]POG97896.1 energy-coupling factor transporter ATPase [Fructilactobacillus lindneri]POG99228.1 energy-coupling factor transporter ATPase [Fructilactobacil